MYHKNPDWSREPKDVYRKVGSPELPSRPLVEYALTTPGVHTLIIGIGQIDEDSMKCQLVQNYYAAQIEPDGMPAREREKIEDHAGKVKDGKANYFQVIENEGLTPPQKPEVIETDDKKRIIWQTAYAGNDPISHYEVIMDGEVVGKVEHHPQILKSRPFVYETDKQADRIQVAAVDKKGKRAETNVV